MHLVLLQVGMPLDSVNWIMGCVSSANFYVLVNGSLSGLFNASRGIHQGFPLSPLLFLLVIEGLSLLIWESKRKGIIQRIIISPLLSITHLLFVDDVDLFGYGSRGNVLHIKIFWIYFMLHHVCAYVKRDLLYSVTTCKWRLETVSKLSSRIRWN